MEEKKRAANPGSAVEVIRGVRDVDIKDDIPDAKSFADKYDVEVDDPTNGIGMRDEGEVLQGIMLNQDLVKRTEGLVRKLDEKNREVERLCTLLESVSIVPGMNPDRLLGIYDNVAEEPIDLRDSKIVHLAKKVRTLTMALNKERGLKAAADVHREELRHEIDQLKQDLKLISSPAARAAARGENKDTRPTDSGAAPKDMRKDLTLANKQVEELRLKLHSSAEENKRLQRALVKEIGDGTSLDQALDDGWKGRAQQIIMLKNKIKRLESGGDGSVFSADSAATRSSLRKGVDAKAEMDLAEMSSERQRAVDNLTSEHSRLVEEHQDLIRKCDRHKIRARTLESENAKQRENLKMMVDKGDSDDQLIEALKQENQRLREGLQKLVQKQREAEQSCIPREARAVGAISAPSSSSEIEIEIIRLNRLIKQQASQLEAQDTLIRKFRAAEIIKYG